MHITIQIDTGDKLSDQDKAVLLALSGAPAGTTFVNVNNGGGAPAAAPEPAAKKAAEKPPTVAAPAPEAKTEEPEEELVPEAQTFDIRDAIKVGTDAVSQGKGKQVKEKLTELGVAQISKLEGQTIADFIAAFS